MGCGCLRSSAALAAPVGKRRFRRWRWVVGLIGIAVLACGTRSWTLTALARSLDVSEPPRRVDCVMVLGGDSTTRPFVAAALFRAGLAQRILVPTVESWPEVKDNITPPDHELIQSVLRARGVPSEAIVLLPGECTSTLDEARALASYLDRAPASSVAIVTNPYHTRRASWVFRKILGERAVQVQFVAAPTDGFDATNWWHYERGFKTYLNECGKVVSSVLRLSGG